MEKVHKDMNLGEYPEFANPNGWAKLKKHLKIVPVTRSRLVNLEFVSYDNVLATKIANTIAKIFVEENVTNRVSIAQEVISACGDRTTYESGYLTSKCRYLMENTAFAKSLSINISPIRSSPSSFGSSP